MMIINIWKNKSHVPVTTNQFCSENVVRVASSSKFHPVSPLSMYVHVFGAFEPRAKISPHVP